MASGKRKKDDKSLSELEEVKLYPKKKYKTDSSEPPEAFQNSDALRVINEFLQRCEFAEHTTVVIEYFESGKTAQDLVSLLQRNKSANFVPVLSLLHFIVITVIRDAPEYKADTEEACKYLLEHFLSEMQEMLSYKSTAKHKKIVLKLFAAMVTLNAKLGRTILVHIKFTPHMLTALTKHNRPSETSVRTCFIHFLMSFFIDKNALLINSLLQKKGIIGSIISGLMYDDACTVNLVLTTLYENVIINTNISKTLKLHTFSTPIIQLLLKLYNWEGPEKLQAKNYSKHTFEEETNDDEKKSVVEVLHNFLVTLCTSHKHGVAFHDKYVGTSSKKCNELLQGVVESMEKPWENQYLSQLTLAILASCPDLVKKVIPLLEPYLEPRISLHWMKAVEFTKNIIQSTDPNVSLKPHVHSLKVQQLINVVNTLAIPASVLRIVNEKMLQHKHLLVRHEGTQLLSIMLDKFCNYIKALKSWKLINESVLQSVCGEVIKQMPNPEVVLSLWKRALNCKTKDEDSSLTLPTVALHLSSVLDLWSLYNQSFSSALKLTNSIELLNDIQDLEDDNMHLQLKILELIMTLDSSALKLESDVFRIAMLQISNFTNHPSQAIVSQSKKIFTNLLINSGIFEGVESEVNIWAHCCFKVARKCVKTVMELLLEAMVDINKNPSLYANTIAQAEESTDNYSSKDSGNLQQMFEDLLESQQYESDLHSHMKWSYQVTLSLLLPAVLKVTHSCKEFEENRGVTIFLSSVIIHLIHSHPFPRVICCLLQNYKDLIPFSVSTYISGQVNKNVIMVILGKNSIEGKLSKYLIDGEGSLLVVLNLEFTTNGTKNEESVPIILKKETVFVSKVNIKEADPVQLVLLYKLAVFHLTQMALQDILQESSKRHCEDALKLLLAVLRSFDEEQETQYTADCLKFTFTQPGLLSLFRPLLKKKTSKMIIEIVEELINTVLLSAVEGKHLLTPFKQKIIHKIIKYIRKCQKIELNEERNLPTLSLYGFTSADITLLMDHLVLVPVENLYYCKEEVKQLSALGRTLSELLNLCVLIHKPLSSHCLVAVVERFVKMKKLLVVDIDIVEQNLYRYLDTFRHHLDSIPGYLFYSLLLQEIGSCSVQLATLLLRHKTNVSEFFVSFLRKNRKFRSNSEVLFPLFSAFIEHFGDSVEQDILEKVYTHYCNDIRQGILVPLEAAAWLKHYEHIAVLLVEKCMDLNTSVTLCKQMEAGIKMEKSEDFCLGITKAVLCKVNRLAPEEFKASVVLVIVMQLVNDLWKQNLSDKKQLESIYLFVKECAESSNDDSNCVKWQELKGGNVWLNFVSMALKYGIQMHKEVLDPDGYLLRTLAQLCSLVYIKTTEENEVQKIFQMTLSHSEFLSVILGNATKKKLHLIQLLLVLTEKKPSVMSSTHVPIMLSAYNSTLGEVDQNMLKVLQIYEVNGIHFYNYKPYLWGEAAANHYTVKSKARFALWRQPKPSQILDLLDTERVQQTVKKFPITRDLDGVCSVTVTDDEVYDIAFLLPLFSHLLAPEQFVQTYKFLSCGGLALTLSALASECEMTRKAAYHVLSRFYFHEEANRNIKKRMLCIQFLDAVRLGVVNLNNGSSPQLSCIVTTFLARASLIIAQANHPLYSQIQNFIVAKPSINLQTVPEFLTYFHSADMEYKFHRHWMLEVLRDGFRSELDLKVCLRSAVFKLLHNFYLSVLADSSVRTLVLEVINAAVKVSRVAWVLVADFGLFLQLYHIIRQFPEHSSGQTVIVNILHNLWASLSSTTLDDWKKKTGRNMDWSQQMILLLLFVLSLKPNLAEAELKTYLLTLHAVLSYSNSRYIPYLLSLEKMYCLLQFATKIIGPLPDCGDMLKFGCRHVVVKEDMCTDLGDSKTSQYYLKKIIIEWFRKVHNFKAPKMKQ